MNDTGKGRGQLLTLALAMILSVWVHVLVLAMWRYVEPEAAAPPPIPPLAIEIEMPKSEEPPPAPPDRPPAPKPPDAPAPPPDSQTPQPLPTAPVLPLPQGDSPIPEARPSELDEDTISLESQAPEYLSYLAQIKAAVRAHWIFPPEAMKKKAHGRLTAVFTLDQTGELIRIMVEESSGHPILDHAAMEAVRGAAPFPPFPDHVQVKRLNIRANFDYRIKYVQVK
jgi:protein TonB